ncbi:MAG: hypothetical protein WA970_05520 [Gammaproteobacteria bacterium]|jgi:hypothetical protein
MIEKLVIATDQIGYHLNIDGQEGCANVVYFGAEGVAGAMRLYAEKRIPVFDCRVEKGAPAEALRRLAEEELRNYLQNPEATTH